MSHSFKFGSLRGVPLGAHWSLFAILALLVVTLGPTFASIGAPLPALFGYLVAAAAAVAFMGSVMAHELGHVVVALRNGVPVHRVTLWALGGQAELESAMPSPGAAARIAFAGPAMSLVCAATFGAVGAGVWLFAPASLAAIALLWLAAMNVLIATFNLLPGAPLDGGHVVAAVGWKLTSSRARGDLAAAYAGLGVAYLLVAWGVWRTIAGDFGVFTVLVGLYLASQAGGQVRAARAELSATGDVNAPSSPAAPVATETSSATTPAGGYPPAAGVWQPGAVGDPSNATGPPGVLGPAGTGGVHG